MNTFLMVLLQLFLLLAVAPLLPGIINRVKARFAGRRGQPLLQTWFDLFKLFSKSTVVSRTTSPVFFAGPILSVAAPVLAFLLIPIGALDAPFSFIGDGILVLYLFGLSRFFTVASALDTGSSFEGMGGAREVTFATLTEPTLLFIFMALALMSNGLTLNDWWGDHLSASWSIRGASLALIVACLFIVLLVENCRIPFDDPDTHLELTMIHEVMVLDHSGPAMGLIVYGAAMKLMVLGTLVVRLLFPFSLPHPLLDAVALPACLCVLAAVIGVIESTMARFRLTRIPQILTGTTLLSIFAVILVIR